MIGIIAFVIFVIAAVLATLWLRVVLITYHFKDSGLIVRFLGMPFCRIEYQDIRCCEVVKARQLWRLEVFFGSYTWLHKRFLFVDGIIIKTARNKYVLTPENPQEFSDAIAQLKQNLNNSSK